MSVAVNGPLVVDDLELAIRGALDGIGLAFVGEQEVFSYLEEGELIRVLQDWCPSYTGYHLYFPERRQASPAFRVVVDALRYRP